MESVLAEYQASLAELTFNSKPHINMLTILAEENVSYASDIAKIIEKQIFQVSHKQRMPVLYLLDSIVKNFGGQYMKLFTNRLIAVFMCIFEKADGKTRADLYKLRSTWDGIFPAQLLKDLDVTVRNLDPNWPVRSKKRRRSRNPLALGHPSPKAEDNDEQLNVYHQVKDEVEEVVEEEEIEMDEESLGVLEMLEEKLRKRQAELSRLEYLESKDKVVKTPTFLHADSIDDGPETNDVDDSLKIDLSEYPVIPMEDIKEEPVKKFEPVSLSQVKSRPLPGSIEEDLSDTSHWLSHASSFEPKVDRVHTHAFDGMTTNRVISHFEPATKQEIKTPEEPPSALFALKQESPASPPVRPSLSTSSTQTVKLETDEKHTQASVQYTDQTTQYRYKRKTKNFTSQYRVPTKTVGTYFRIKSKEVGTQYDPPPTQDTAADSTCLDDDVISPSPLRGASKKAGRVEHSLHILHSLRKQRASGVLCDITLSVQNKHFKAHKAVLASCSDFFHTLFASEAIKQSPLSYIELQGITASALELLLDYLYTSEVRLDGKVAEFITAAKRLKITSLSSVCNYMEEAINAGQDLSGWKITSSGLLSPNSDQAYPLPSSPTKTEQNSVTEKPPEETRKATDGSSSSEDIPLKKTKARERSESRDQKSKKRKERSQSQGGAVRSKKRLKSKNLSTDESDVPLKPPPPVPSHRRKESNENFKSTAKLSTNKSKVHGGTTNRKKAARSKKEAQPSKSNPITEETASDTAAPPTTTVDPEPTPAAPAPEPSTKTSSPPQESEPSTRKANKSEQMQLRLYQCAICEEIFSVQCFYKAHMAGHRRNGELIG